MSDANVELVHRAIDAFNRRDLEAITTLNHAHVEVDWSASRGLDPRVYRGFEEVAGFYDSLFEMFDRIHLEPDRIVASGDAVVVPNIARFRGRDGVETTARSALVFEVRDGRLARVRLYQREREALDAVERNTRGL